MKRNILNRLLTIAPIPVGILFYYHTGLQTPGIPLAAKRRPVQNRTITNLFVKKF